MPYQLAEDPSWVNGQRSDVLPNDGYYTVTITEAKETDQNDQKPGVNFVLTIQDEDEKGKILKMKITYADNMAWRWRQLVESTYGLAMARQGGEMSGAPFLGKTAYVKTQGKVGDNGSDYTEIDTLVSSEVVEQARANGRLRWPRQVRQSPAKTGGVFGASAAGGGVFGAPATPAAAPPAAAPATHVASMPLSAVPVGFGAAPPTTNSAPPAPAQAASPFANLRR